MISGFQGLAIDPHPVDGSGDSHHRPRYYAALEGWACRPGAGHEPVAVAEHHLGVGAHIHQDAQLAGTMEANGQDIGDEIAAEIGANAGKEVGQSPGMNGQFEILPGHQRKLVHGRKIRLPAKR